MVGIENLCQRLNERRLRCWRFCTACLSPTSPSLGQLLSPRSCPWPWSDTPRLIPCCLRAAAVSARRSAASKTMRCPSENSRCSRGCGHAGAGGAAGCGEPAVAAVVAVVACTTDRVSSVMFRTGWPFSLRTRACVRAFVCARVRARACVLHWLILRALACTPASHAGAPHKPARQELPRTVQGGGIEQLVAVRFIHPRACQHLTRHNDLEGRSSPVERGY